MSGLLPLTAPLGRSLLALVFLLSGLTKIGAYEATQGYMAAMGVPGVLLPAVIGFEFIAPLALIIGFYARSAAFLLAGFSLLTALIFHFDFADQIQTVMFLKNVSIAGGLLLLVAHGPGKLAVNNR
ncbi:MAG: DoxX family protein [Pseudomonadota bacterium]